MTGWSNTALTAAGQSFGPVEHDQDRPGHIQAPVPQAGQQVGDDGGVLGGAFHHPEGMFGAVEADAQGHHTEVIGEVDPVDHDRDQVQVGQVGGHHLGQGRLGGGHEPPGHRRLRRRRGGGLHRGPDRFQAGGVAAGGQLGHHPFQGQATQDLGRGEQLVAGHGQLGAAIGRPHPRSAHRHPAAPQGDRTVVVAVTDRHPVRVPPALGASQGGHVVVHHRLHDLQPGAHRQGQQPLPGRLGQLGHGHHHRVGQRPLRHTVIHRR